MAKSSSGNRAWAFVLSLIGSLIYLYAAFAFLGTGNPASSLFSGSGAFLLPLFAGVGVVSAVGLFLASFGLLKGGDEPTKWTWKSAMWGGVALVALFAGTSMAWYVVLGFLLASVGSIAAKM